MGRIHDLGGMSGFGPIPGRDDETNFHHAWEARVFAMVRSLVHNGVFNWDEFRHAVERMEPAIYLRTPYYQRWLDGLERLCLEKAVLNEADRRAIATAGALPSDGQAP